MPASALNLRPRSAPGTPPSALRPRRGRAVPGAPRTPPHAPGDLFLRKTQRHFHHPLVPAMARRTAGTDAAGHMDAPVVAFLEPNPANRRHLAAHLHGRSLARLGRLVDAALNANDPETTRLRHDLTRFLESRTDLLRSFQWNRMSVIPC